MYEHPRGNAASTRDPEAHGGGDCPHVGGSRRVLGGHVRRRDRRGGKKRCCSNRHHRTKQKCSSVFTEVSVCFGSTDDQRNSFSKFRVRLICWPQISGDPFGNLFNICAACIVELCTLNDHRLECVLCGAFVLACTQNELIVS